VAIKFQRGLHGEGEIDRVGEILRRHPGRCGVAIVVESFDDGNPSIKLRYLLAPASTTRVAADAGLAAELEQVLGAGNVRFLSSQKGKPGANGNGHKIGAGRRTATTG
jgi:DNA polymerase III subunit alpha